ncbi:helix-turn-helix domain-containing protein [Bibersteinia trehalosi]|uniref:helix-turn-helix domain-containing protein n=1 Tax=Bibersteinia trehalosi TaxID=47735 RepID=UPI002D76DF68|nr:helix-turn-helix domain-containing protein [Bibersteinia trehalosi]
MEDTLSIKQVAQHLGMDYNTVYHHRFNWGFFRLKGSKLWRINKSDLEQLKKRSNNTDRLALSVDEVQLCRSSNEKKTAHGGLISQPQAVKELDALLARL